MTEKNANQLRQAENKVEIEGLLLEIESKEGTTSDGREYLSATLTIETGENKQHNISMFSMKLKADGTENGIYNSLKTVVDEYKSVAEVGRDEADRVRTTTGSIALNEYVGQDGQLRSYPQIDATFVNRVDAGDEYEPKAEFQTEMVVSKVIEEIDKNTEEETGRVKLSGYIPLYGGKVIPFDFVVNEDGSPYVEDNYEPGDTVFVYGDIVNRKEQTVRKIEAAFGADKEEIHYNTVREWIVTGGLEPYDEDDPKAYSTEAIKKALAEREVYLEEMKEKAKNKDNKKQRGGFDTRPKKKKTSEPNFDDLPF